MVERQVGTASRAPTSHPAASRSGDPQVEMECKVSTVSDSRPPRPHPRAGNRTERLDVRSDPGPPCVPSVWSEGTLRRRGPAAAAAWVGAQERVGIRAIQEKTPTDQHGPQVAAARCIQRCMRGGAHWSSSSRTAGSGAVLLVDQNSTGPVPRAARSRAQAAALAE